MLQSVMQKVLRNCLYLPILFGCLLLWVNFSFVLVHTVGEKKISEEDILNSSALRAISSPEYYYSVFTCFGMMIPFTTDQICLYLKPNGITNTSSVDRYIVPFLIFIMQFYNTFFILLPRSEFYFWMYFQGTSVQLFVVSTTFICIQISQAAKYPNIQLVAVISSALIDIGITCKVANFMSTGLQQTVFYGISAVSYTFCILCNIYIASEWLKHHWETQKIDSKNYLHLYSFYKINLLSCGIILYGILDYVYLPNQYILHYTEGSAVAVNIVITLMVYGLIEIQYLYSRDLARFAVEALETKRTFVRYVSHEIRTPLNSASLGLQLLQKEANRFNNKQHKYRLEQFPSGLCPDSADVESFLELISDTNDACNIAIDILNDLLLYEKIDGGLLSMEATDVSLMTFVKDVVKVFVVQAKALELDLILQNFIPTDSIIVNIDAYKMGQVLRNLISNALKFSKCGETVIVKVEFADCCGDKENSSSTIPGEPVSPFAFSSSYSSYLSPFSSPPGSTKTHGEHARPQFVRISVQDSGAGITPENQKKLFHEIVQFDAAKLQQGKGSGIGLWISSKIMKLHSGHIGVLSNGIDCGSTFYIDIPIHKTIADLPVNNFVKNAAATTYSGGAKENTGKEKKLTSEERSNNPVMKRTTTLHQRTCSEIENGQSRRGYSGDGDRNSRNNMSDNLSENSYSQLVCTTTLSTVIDHFEDIPCIDDDAQVTSSTSFDSIDDATTTTTTRPQHGHTMRSLHRQHAMIMKKEDEEEDERIASLKRTLSKSLVLESLSMVKLSRPPSMLYSPTARSTSAVGISTSSTSSTASSSASAASSFSSTLSQRRLVVHSTADSFTPPQPVNTLETALSPTPAPAVPAVSKNYRLLIVDDSAVNRKMLKRVLKELFTTIDEATDGKDCLRQLHIATGATAGIPIYYDIIIMDYWMPEMTGLEATKVIRASGYTGQIIGLTGNTEQSMKTEFEEAGVNQVLTKPYHGVDLITLFESLLQEMDVLKKQS